MEVLLVQYLLGDYMHILRWSLRHRVMAKQTRRDECQI